VADALCLLANIVMAWNTDPLQPFKIPESRLLFIYFADIRRGAAGVTDCRSRMAGLQGFFAFA
jgi:hypothetical protein